MARDCTVNKDPNAQASFGGGGPGGPSQALTRSGFDSEYANLMAELGEGGGGNDPAKTSWAPSAGHDITAGGTNIPPWRRPEVWAQPAPPQQQLRPPQGAYGGYGAQGYGASGAGGQWAGYFGAGGSQQSQDYANYASYYQGQYAQQTGQA